MYIEKFQDVYGVVKTHADKILEELSKEEVKFQRTIKQGLKELQKLVQLKIKSGVINIDSLQDEEIFDSPQDSKYKKNQLS
jgi:alanyl-tRNA synthetase